MWCIACYYGLMCGRLIISCAHSKKSVNAVVPNALSHLVFVNTIETRFKLFSVRLTTASTVTTCDAYLPTVAITTTVTKGNGTNYHNYDDDCKEKKSSDPYDCVNRSLILQK